VSFEEPQTPTGCGIHVVLLPNGNGGFNTYVYDLGPCWDGLFDFWQYDLESGDADVSGDCVGRSFVSGGQNPCSGGSTGTLGWNPINPRRFLFLENLDRSDLTNPCLIAVSNALNTIESLGYMRTLYTLIAEQNPSTPIEIAEVRISQTVGLTTPQGHPVNASSLTTIGPDGKYRALIQIDLSTIPNASQEYLAKLILHEYAHIILTALKPQITDLTAQHEQFVTTALVQLIQTELMTLFSSANVANPIDADDAMALALSGMDDYLFTNGAPDPNINAILISMYNMSIQEVIIRRDAHKSGGSGTPCP
jgi:hypothetical protein